MAGSDIKERASSDIEKAYWLLRQEILAGRLAPGEKLRIDYLKSTYGYGASGIREALSRLLSDGLVASEAQTAHDPLGGEVGARGEGDDLRHVEPRKSVLEHRPHGLGDEAPAPGSWMQPPGRLDSGMKRQATTDRLQAGGPHQLAGRVLHDPDAPLIFGQKLPFPLKGQGGKVGRQGSAQPIGDVGIGMEGLESG